MAKKVEFEAIVKADVSGFAAVERAAIASNARMNKAFIESYARNGAGAGGRFGGRSFGVASSMFTSVARDSAASLASGAPITQVIAQQAPQVLQALQMMGAGLLGLKAAAILAGVAITGYIVSGLIKSYIGTTALKQSFLGLESALDRLRIKQEQWDQARRIGAKAAADDFDRVVASATYNEKAADSAHDLAKAEATKSFWLNNSIRTKEKEVELEKQLLRMDEARAKAKLDQATLGQKYNADLAKAHSDVLAVGKEFDAAQNQYESDLESARKSTPIKFGIFSNPTPEDRAARNKALAEVENRNSQRLSELYEKDRQARQNLLEAQRRSSQPEIDAAKAELTTIQNQLSAPRDLSALKAAGASSRGSIFGGDALTQVGNFLGAGSGLVNSIGQQQLDEARKQTKHLQDVVKNTATTTTTSSGTMDIP